MNPRAKDLAFTSGGAEMLTGAPIVAESDGKKNISVWSCLATSYTNTKILS